MCSGLLCFDVAFSKAREPAGVLGVELLDIALRKALVVHPHDRDEGVDVVVAVVVKTANGECRVAVAVRGMEGVHLELAANLLNEDLVVVRAVLVSHHDMIPPVRLSEAVRALVRAATRGSDATETIVAEVEAAIVAAVVVAEDPAPVV